MYVNVFKNECTADKRVEILDRWDVPARGSHHRYQTECCAGKPIGTIHMLHTYLHTYIHTCIHVVTMSRTNNVLYVVKYE